MVKDSLYKIAKKYVLIAVLVIYALSFCLPTLDDGSQQIGFLRKDANSQPYYQQVLYGWEVFLQVPLKFPY